DMYIISLFFFSSRRRHTSSKRDWSSDVCSSDLLPSVFHFYKLPDFFLLFSETHRRDVRLNALTYLNHNLYLIIKNSNLNHILVLKETPPPNYYFKNGYYVYNVFLLFILSISKIY